MARTSAQLKTSTLADPEFTSLPLEAEWLYWVLLQQPRLNLVGVVDLMPDRWARAASNIDPAGILAILEVLERERYVLIDWTTAEVLIRTFMRHDLHPGRLSAQVIKGLWGAYSTVISRPLRAQIVRLMTETLWEKAEKEAPAEALETRRSCPIEWEPQVPIERETASPMLSPSPVPVPCPRPLSPDPNSISPDAYAAEPAPVAAAADQIEAVTRQTIGIIARQRANRPGTTNPAGLAIHIGRTIATDPAEAKLIAEIRELAEAGLTAANIAAEVEPPPSTTGRDFLNGTDRGTAPSPEAQAAAAAEARERALKRERETLEALYAPVDIAPPARAKALAAQAKAGLHPQQADQTDHNLTEEPT